jgi:hypothetical protein
MQDTDSQWSALCGALPSHQDALMDGYHPDPSIAEQDRTHGAGTPAVDRGLTEEQKYGYGGHK